LANGIDAAVGRRLREIREAAGILQEELAQMAFAYGFDWDRSTVAGIETGRRRLKLGEFLLLPHMLATARAGSFELEDLIPEGSKVAITPRVSAAPEQLRKILRGQAGRVGDTEIAHAYAADDVHGRRLESEAERKVARQLGVNVVDVVDASFTLWGQPLASERDARTQQRLAPDAPPRTLQAVRGHVTRELVADLKQALRSRSRRR